MRAMARVGTALLVAALAGCGGEEPPPDRGPGQAAWSLAIHGGARNLQPGDYTDGERATIRAELAAALQAGARVLDAGGSSLDAVEAVVVAMEDSPWFNAGRGAVFTHDGRNELDASIMDGATGQAGAVAGVTRIRNPVRLARRVMERTPHVMLAGAGAEAFADTRPEIARVPNRWFDTEHRRRQLEQAQADEKRQAALGLPPKKGTYFGTVGAVALDAQGHIAAATSTGGMTNKKWGRVGDSPIIGAGTWADERCGVSGTGWGEFYIRNAVAHDICARVAYRGDSLAAAAEEVVDRIVPAAGGDGGAIALDRDGNIAMPFKTSGMYRGWVRPDGSRGVAIFRDEQQ